MMTLRVCRSAIRGKTRYLRPPDWSTIEMEAFPPSGARRCPRKPLPDPRCAPPLPCAQAPKEVVMLKSVAGLLTALLVTGTSLAHAQTTATTTPAVPERPKLSQADLKALTDARV